MRQKKVEALAGGAGAVAGGAAGVGTASGGVDGGAMGGLDVDGDDGFGGVRE